MKQLNLTATNPSQELIKNYLEQNASDTLAEKINNGVQIVKDGKTLINKKTLDGFMSYASEEARKLAEKSARYACIEHTVVFGWAIHYFEEDSIEEKLYNEDGTEYKKQTAPKKAETKKPTTTPENTPKQPEKVTPPTNTPTPTKKPTEAKKQSAQISIFDLF